MSITKAQQEVEQKARERLREVCKPGDTLHTILRHVSRSGMSRSISVVISGEDEPWDVSYLVARALGRKIDQTNGGVKVSGCGMDMGFALVYELSYALYPDGFDCVGEAPNGGHWTKGCPANDHSNDSLTNEVPRELRYAPTRRHKDGGYALRQRWL